MKMPGKKNLVNFTVGALALFSIWATWETAPSGLYFLFVLTGIAMNGACMSMLLDMTRTDRLQLALYVCGFFVISPGFMYLSQPVLGYSAAYWSWVLPLAFLVAIFVSRWIVSDRAVQGKSQTVHLNQEVG